MLGNVLAISRLFSSPIYMAERFFSFIQGLSRNQSRVGIGVEKALLCGDCCDRNQTIILVA